MTTPRLSRSAAALLAIALLGCDKRVGIADLSEGDAEGVLSTLQKSGIDARKEPLRAGSEQFTVEVSREDEPTARAVLAWLGDAARGAGRPPEAGGAASLLPGRETERTRLSSETAAGLERSLTALSSVLAARVHLATPIRAPFAQEPESTAPSASVLLTERPGEPRVDTASLQRLVAGAVTGLDPTQVSILRETLPLAELSARSASAHDLTQVGPFTVAATSAPLLRWLLGGVVTLNLLLVTAALLFWLRTRGLLPTKRPLHTRLSEQRFLQADT